MVLYTLGISALQLFTPLYLYQQRIEISWIIVFFAIFNFWRFLTVPLAGLMTGSWGAKRTLFLGCILTALSYVLLS